MCPSAKAVMVVLDRKLGGETSNELNMLRMFLISHLETKSDEDINDTLNYILDIINDCCLEVEKIGEGL